MTVRAIAGLLMFDAALTLVGFALLFGFRGLRSWGEVIRFAGLAFLIGFAAVAAALTAVLAVGVAFGWPTLAATCVAVAGIGLTAGMRASRARPAAFGRVRLPHLSLVAGLFLAAFALYFESLFRATRLAGLSEWDAWRCWALRPKALWLFDGFDPTLFGDGAPRCPGYPPGLATIEASAFETMGGADVVTYMLQSWVLALAFVAAVAGLLATRVRAHFLLPFLLLAVVAPSVTDRVADGRADLPLAYLVAVGGVLVFLWLDDREWWRLPTAAVLMGGAMLTKREGVLLVACVLGAALVVDRREWRFAWPRLVAVGLVAAAMTLPWRLWLAAEGAASGAPPEGFVALDALDRVWPSLRLVVETSFDYGLWRVAVPLGLAAALVGLLGGAFRVSVFMLSFSALSVIACSWAIWAEPNLELTQDYGLNPVVRLVGGPIIVLTVLAPLALEHGWVRTAARSQPDPVAPPERPAWRSALSWALVIGVALAYPLSAVTGYSGMRLPGGMPVFPSANQCVVVARGDDLRVVLGYTEGYAEAETIGARARSVGVDVFKIGHDGCGRLRVYVDGLGREEAAALAARLATGGLDPSIEGVPGA